VSGSLWARLAAIASPLAAALIAATAAAQPANTDVAGGAGRRPAASGPVDAGVSSEDGRRFGVSGSVLFATDYVLRGISLTQRRPAIQLSDFEVRDGRTGLYANLFASNVAFRGTDVRLEAVFSAGLRFEAFGADWDVSASYNSYHPGGSGSGRNGGLDFFSATLEATRAFGPVQLAGAATVSPNYVGRSGTALLLDGAVEWRPLPALDLTLSGRMGRVWVARGERFGLPDYTWWSAELSWEAPSNVFVTLGWHATDIRRDACFEGEKVCRAGVLLSVGRRF